MHRLAHVRIRRFRLCEDVSLSLASYCPLVGQNNCGKSTIIAAIDWLLRPYALAAKDFGNAGEPVSVAGDIVGLTEEHLAQLTQEHRDRIEPFCVGGKLAIRRTQSAPAGGARATTLEVRDPATPDENAEGAWKRNPNGIDASIRALFPEPIHIAAMQDAAEDVTSGKKESTIGRLAATLVGKLQDAHGAHLTQAIAEVSKRLSATGEDRAPELQAFDEGANKNLAELFSGLQVRLHFEPPAITDLLRAGTIKVYEGGAQQERDVGCLGHGAQRAIQMALVRYLAEIARAGAESTCTLLLIDEPELYLHPFAIEQVRLALLRLTSLGFQVIFSTHSSLLIGHEDVRNTVMVYRTDNSGTLVRKRIAEAWEEATDEAPGQSRKLFELGTASQILFASSVVIAEGETEKRLLPLVYEAMRGRPMMAAGLALITAGGSGSTAKCMRLLSALGIPAAAVVDLDYAFRRAVKSGLLSADDPDIAAVRMLVAEIKDAHGFAVGGDGFPTKGAGFTAAEGFCCVAKDDRAKAHIAVLSAKLRAAGYWLWERGAIEEHLGLEEKGEDAWSEYAAKLRSETVENAIVDYTGFVSLLSWLESDMVGVEVG